MNIWSLDNFVFKPVNETVSKIKLTIDNTKVDYDLTNFPISVGLSSSAGQTSFDATDVFDTLLVYDNRKKIYAIDSGSNKLFTEIERWDQDNEEANLWVKVPTVYSATGTVFYLYYSVTIDEQTAYTGDIGDTPAQNVWDDYFTAVWHMSQDPLGGTDCIIDSTGSGTHGTPVGDMTSDDLVDGKIGQAIDFDGSDDLINCGTNTANDVTGALTAEAIFKTSEVKTQRIVTKDNVDAPNRKYELHINSDESVAANIYQTNSTNANVNTDNGLGGNFIDGAYHHAAVAIDTYVPTITTIDGLYITADGTPTSSTLTSRPCLVDGETYVDCLAYLSWATFASAGIDLGSAKTLAKIRFHGHAQASSSQLYRYFATDADSIEVYKSDNNSSWTLVDQFTDMLIEGYYHPVFGYTWVYWTVTFSVPHTARYFKLSTATFGRPRITTIPQSTGGTYMNIDEIVPIAGDSNARLYIDGTLNVTSSAEISSIQSQPSVPVLIGDSYNEASDYAFKGVIDEVRLSSVRRDAEWIKATYYSSWDNLITYSDPEIITLSSYVNVYDKLTETLSGTIYHNADINSVWANNDYLYIGTTNSGVIWSPMSSISGAVYDNFSVYKAYPDVYNNHVNYIHGAGNYLCVATTSGVNIIDLTTNSGVYANASIVASKCYQVEDRTSYYIYDDKLNTVYNDDSTYLYQGGDNIIPTVSGINDVYVVNETKNVIFLATTAGTVVIEENKGSELLSRFKYYYVEE